LKNVKKPYDCSEEKKEIERLRQELALRTPKKVFDPEYDTPQSTKSTRALWAKPSPHKPTTSTSRVLSFNNDISPRDRRYVPTSPNRGGRRRTRKQRKKGGMFKKKKKKSERRSFEEMMGFPPTPEQQRAAAAAATKEAESYEHIPSAAEVAEEERFSKISPRRRATYPEHVAAVASHHAGQGEKPRRGQPKAKDTIRMTKDTITKLKKILENKKVKRDESSRKFLNKKIDELETLVEALEEEYTFIKKPADI
jgi:hypothetical protein